MALFLQPKEIHHFEDFGYKHSDFWVQPDNAADKQMPDIDLSDQSWAEEVPGAPGCRCEKSEWKTRGKATNLAPTCFRRLGEAIKSG